MKLLLTFVSLTLPLFLLCQVDTIWPCIQPSASVELDINNVRALIHNGGDMWWDLQGNAVYEIPKGSGKQPAFAGGIWIGAISGEQQLKTAAVRYRSAGTDYYPGPLIKTGVHQAITKNGECIKWDEIYKINKQDVRTFRDWYNADQQTKDLLFPNYIIPDIILNWPAHGDVSKGYDFYMAPFYDNDKDGVYNPENGDYPNFDLDNAANCDIDNILFGDQCLWYVFNDGGGPHYETLGEALGIEIHTQAFAYITADEISNTTFYQYKVINRSTETLYNTYFGNWTDADMGYCWDDYIGSNVELGLGYIYNGDLEDGDGNGITYGLNPPAFGMDYIKGPRIDADGIDNPFGGCNASINGQNFGDNIADNERWGMESFMYFNCSASPQGSPSISSEYYSFLQGAWRCGEPLTYGGNGYGGSITAKYMFPGNTDPCGYGQSGIVMPPWSEELEGNTPFDRRFLISTGPVTMEPGAVNDFTAAAVWARPADSTDLDAVTKLELADKRAQAYFDNCFRLITGPDAPELDIIETDSKLIFNLYNDPTSNNYMESYHELEPMVICHGEYNCNRYYDFQGYQVFMLKDSTVTEKDLDDTTKAILIFQCDLNDNIDSLINYEADYENNLIVPKLKVAGYDVGLVYSFEVINDPFDYYSQITNGKEYYFMSTAYAYNNYYNVSYLTPYPDSLYGQKQPFKRGPGKLFKSRPHEITDKMQVNIFPNPNFGFFYVEINNSKSFEILMKVYNTKGKIVKEETFNSEKNQLHIKSLYGLETGVYFIEFSSDKTKQVEKIIIK